MKINVLQCFTCVIAALVWLPINSDSDQEQDGLPKPMSQLSLEDAINIGLQHSPLIKQAELNVALAELDLKSTKWWKSLFLPNLNIGSRYDPIFGDSRIGIALSFDLRSILNERDQSKRAKIKLFDAQIYQNNTKARVIEAVTKSFFDHRLALERVTVYEDKLAQDAKLLELSRVKFETGKIELDELLKLEYLLSEDKLKLLEAKADLQLKELKLRQEMGGN